MAIAAPYHIVLQRKNQVLLSFLKIRAVVNGKEIYPLPDTRPVVIPVQANHPRIVITDGYHITAPLKLVYKDLPVYCFKVACAVSDGQLLGGFGALAILYLSGFYSGILALKVFSFIPVIYLLAFYYLNRKEFIRLIPVTN
ncbi:MAG: hypothetical protein HZA79_07260 [Sphingobacteriales bacterium]|nr:hypothetical protein [Sphingobacteriales bacterium]